MTEFTAKKRNDGLFVFLCFLGFFSIVAAVDFYFVTTAIGTHTGVITDRAYERGLDYNNTLKQAEEQAALGFKDKIRYADNILSWKILNTESAPIKDLKVKATFIREVQKGQDFTLPLYETNEGLYTAPVNAPLKGQWLVVIETQWNKKPYKSSSRIMIQ